MKIETVGELKTELQKILEELVHKTRWDSVKHDVSDKIKSLILPNELYTLYYNTKGHGNISAKFEDIKGLTLFNFRAVSNNNNIFDEIDISNTWEIDENDTLKQAYKRLREIGLNEAKSDIQHDINNAEYELEQLKGKLVKIEESIKEL